MRSPFNPDRARVVNGVLEKRAKIPAAYLADETGERFLDKCHAGPDATLEVDGWTRHVLRRELEADGGLTETLGLASHAAWLPAVRETFASLYDPTTPTVEAPKGTAAKWIGDALAMARELPEWHRLAERCFADGLRTGWATEAVLRELADLPPPEDDEPSNEQPDAEEPGDGGIDPSALRQALRAAAQQGEAAIEAQEGRDLFLSGKTWGSAPGSGLTLSGPRDALVKALQASPTLRRTFDLAGRLRATQRRVKASRTRAVPEEIVDLELGGDWSRFLGSELAGLADDDLELYLLRRAIERGVCQYALEGNERVAKGPIVFCLDESSSMTSPFGGATCIEWARALVLVMADLAAREKRPFVLIHFDVHVARVDEPPVGPITVDTLVGMLSFFAGGGTDFSLALHTAADRIAASKRLAKSDVIFLTDGAAGTPYEALDRLDALGARVHGIAVDGVAWNPEFRARLATFAQVSEANDTDPLDGVFGI